MAYRAYRKSRMPRSPSTFQVSRMKYVGRPFGSAGSHTKMPGRLSTMIGRARRHDVNFWSAVGLVRQSIAVARRRPVPAGTDPETLPVTRNSVRSFIFASISSNVLIVVCYAVPRHFAGVGDPPRSGQRIFVLGADSAHLHVSD